jgi:hypothetical protein
VRLARGLGCRSDELLANRAELEIEPGSGWPTLRIRLEDDGRCPFVRDTGCSVYADRPTCCRIFPLARAVRLEGRGEARETFFIAAEGSGCLGFGVEDGLTVARDQGLDPYRAANDRAARLFLHPRRPRPLSLSPPEVHAVIMALYNLDVFRDFVARPGFGARSGLDRVAVERALASDEALLELGQDWLESQLFSAPF